MCQEFERTQGGRLMTRTASVSIVLALSFVTSAGAHTWTVGGPDGDFPLIAPAIAIASPGDTIEVRAGVYREDLVIDKRLTVVGMNRPMLIGTGIGTIITIIAPHTEWRGFVIEGSGTGQTNQMDAGIRVSSNGNRVVDNILRRVFYGIVVVDATHNEIADNEIQGFRELPFGRRGDGIYLYRAPENFVARNRISGERDAIYFQYAPRGRAAENIASHSRYALHDMFSDDTVIARNEFRDSVVGANIMNSRRIKLERNRIGRNRGVPGVGLTLKDCDESIVRGNTIVENGRGLLLDGSSRNQFVDNAFRANETQATSFSAAAMQVHDGRSTAEAISGIDIAASTSTVTGLATRRTRSSEHSSESKATIRQRGCSCRAPQQPVSSSPTVWPRQHRQTHSTTGH
jgi:parallel beta-helix repeat protein